MASFKENNGSNIEEMNCEGQIDDVPFVVFVTGNLNELNKGPQGKNKLNPERCDKIKTFQSKVSTVLIPSKTTQDCSLSAPEVSRRDLS